MTRVSARRHSACSADLPGRSLKSPVYSSVSSLPKRRHCAEPKMWPAGSNISSTPRTDRFITEMRFAAAVFILGVLTLPALGKSAREEPKVVEKVTPLPVALDKDFEFRKTKLFFLSEQTPKASQRTHGTSTLGAKSN